MKVWQNKSSKQKSPLLIFQNFKEGKNNPYFVEMLNIMTGDFYLLMNLTYNAPSKRTLDY